MGHDAYQSIPRTPLALGVLTAIVYAAGFATVAAWFVMVVLDHPRERLAPRIAARCGACGVVQEVREVAPPPRQQLEGSSAEGAVILLAALGGAASADPRPRPVYETAVLHDDGSVRVLRDTRVPQWRPGDRVKVIMGRIAPAGAPPEGDATPGAAAAAPDAARTGRMPNPGLPVAQAR